MIWLAMYNHKGECVVISCSSEEVAQMNAEKYVNHIYFFATLEVV